MKMKPEYSANQAHILELAIDTFGSEETAEAWMNDFNLMLGGTPFAIAESVTGMQEVKKILAAISYGGVA
ncbi:MbcA/ParS/Xre antitoxin family protein [Methylophilus methylotrophus]|uniref:MbcA/ParS/Xre antitoxin family protein n=1 Tax=Methylophilus methylotrophus TaxID=17 RepID=UPI00233F445B|nr:MbcA/ParS/Xre antitoxin family protein [Methylophilus methylotrophus]